MSPASGTIQLRRATAADVPRMAESRNTDSAAGPADARMAAYLEGRHHPQHAMGPRVAYLATIGGDVAGYIAGHLTRRYGCDGEVQYLYVVPAFRRSGIASMLLRQLAEWFEAQGSARICVDVNEESPGATPFYASHGAQPLRPHWMVWPDVRSVLTGQTEGACLRFAAGADATVAPNVKQAVPFFMVTDIEASLRFYVDGVGFAVTNEWRPETVGGRIQWCWLVLGDAALMLQEYRRDGHPGGAPDGPLGQGVSVCFMCADAIAIYHDLMARGVPARRPFVGNGLWVTSVRDPDGYHLDFESPTNVAEETVYSG